MYVYIYTLTHVYIMCLCVIVCVCRSTLPQWISGQQLPDTGLLTSVAPGAQLILGSGHRLVSHTAKKKQ